MEFDKIFITVAFVIIGTMAFFGTSGIATYYNEQYGTDVGSESDVATGIEDIQTNLASSFKGIGNETGVGVEGEEGAGPADANEGLISRSLGIINAIKGAMRMPEKVLTDATKATGMGSDYVPIVETLVIVLFALAFAYLLFLGINK